MNKTVSRLPSLVSSPSSPVSHPSSVAVRPSVVASAFRRTFGRLKPAATTASAIILSLTAVTALVYADQAATTASPAKTHVEALASPRFEGRLAGSRGERLASDYIIGQLKSIGAKPLPGRGDYRLPFQFTAGTHDGGSSLGVSRRDGASVQFGKRTDVQALAFSDSAEIAGPVVFAGYGLVVPDSQDFGYDSYAGLDVKDKIVLVLRYFPEDADQKVRATLARYAALRYKALAARQRGAKAMLVVTGPRSPNAGEVVPMGFDTALAGSGIVAASISGQVADEIVSAASGMTLAKAQEALDSGNPHVPGFAIPDLTLVIRSTVVREKQTGHNIVAYLPASSSTAGVPKPWVVLGAHYDHLGRGRGGNSLAGKDETGQIHFGADDNASGSAAVLAVSQALGRSPRRRHIVLAFWSAEEIGLIGSNTFVTVPPIPLDQIAAYLNFDMVGRMQDNKLSVQGLGTSPAWGRLLEGANVAAGFDLQLQQDPYQPTDSTSFTLARVPSLTFFTGTHADYHRPTDTADKINYEDLDRIVEFAGAVAERVAALDVPPEYVKVEEPAQSGGRAGVRVFTGTIPDYTAEVKGLLLGGVIDGGPADRAGLQKGDIIVEIAAQSITNIYDYTYALELLKVGQPVKVTYIRAGERRDTMLTPAARR